MARSLDYSKWDRIELSDDEENFHDGFDKNLNIKMQRFAREEKEQCLEEERQQAESEGDQARAARLEARKPLHADNICHVTDERTIIAPGPTAPPASAEEVFSTEAFREFRAANAALIGNFVEMDWEESPQALLDHTDVLLDSMTEDVLLLSALDAEVNGKPDLLRKIGLKKQIVGAIRQLAKTTQRPVQSHVRRYFEKFAQGMAREALDHSVTEFVEHIRVKALERRKGAEPRPEVQAATEAAGGFDALRKEKLVDAMHSMAPHRRLGPGGLDPVEVMASLPLAMQEAFKSSSVAMLEEVAAEMDEAEFDAHLQRCVASGLWKSG